jgi:ubiquinone/menaquinone biosynthesis C-methylase UbiE
MSVAAHLGIDLAQYDRKIRTFIPDYDVMLDVAAAAVPSSARTIVDFGTGTGALARRCLLRAQRARIVGIDADTGMLAAAARRLGARASFVAGSFLRVDIPRSDASVASFALHHIRSRSAKSRFYRRVRSSLRAGGRLVIVDCQPAADPVSASAQRAAWLDHLRRSYSQREAVGLLNAWSREDRYVPLRAELDMLERAGFRADVLWRKGAFAVIDASPRSLSGARHRPIVSR